MNRNAKGLSEETKLRILKNAFVDATISGGKLILRRFDGTGENAGSVAGGGLTPAETDAAMAPVLSDPESASAGVLAAAIAAQIPVAVSARNYGVRPSNTAAQNDSGLANLFTDYPGAVAVGFPEIGTYQFSSPLPARSNVAYLGSGLGTLLRWTAGSMLSLTTTVSGLRFRNLSIDNGGTASHLINIGSGGGLTQTVFDACDIRTRIDAASILYMRGTNLFEIAFRDCLLWRNPTATVPAVDISVSSSGVSGISVKGGQWHSQNCNTTPFWKADQTTGSAYLAGLAFEDIAGEQNLGGLIHIGGVNSLRIRNVLDHDGGTYADDLFKITDSTGGAGSYGVDIDQSGTSGQATLASGKHHLLLSGKGYGNRIGRLINGPTASAVVSAPTTGRNVLDGTSIAPSLTVLGAGQGLGTKHEIIIANGSSMTITLPDPVATAVPAGRGYTVKNINSTACTVNSGGTATIDGAASVSLTQYQSARFITDGTNWFKL